MLTKKDKVKNILQENFQDIFSCTRVWSAWGYGTMSLEDFIPFSEDEEALDEIVDNIVSNKLKTVDEVSAVFENYEMYYNSDIDNNFESHCFHDDYLEYVDLDNVSKQLREALSNKNRLRR